MRTSRLRRFGLGQTAQDEHPIGLALYFSIYYSSARDRAIFGASERVVCRPKIARTERVSRRKTSYPTVALPRASSPPPRPSQNGERTRAKWSQQQHPARPYHLLVPLPQLATDKA